MIAGSLGVLPSASLGATDRGLYEPIHGSAPLLAGRGVANPYGAILSVAMLLRHSLHRNDLAAAVEAAVDACISEDLLTPDLGGTARDRRRRRRRGTRGDAPPRRAAGSRIVSIEIYDTTLRDGAQGVGINFSVSDKLRIAEHLDALGVTVIEGGWPGANPTDTEFFAAMRTHPLRTATLAAFGATRRPGTRPEDDLQVRTLFDSMAPIITLVGKTWDRQVVDVLRTTTAENLAMIAETVQWFVDAGRRVVFDAEHFFDGHEQRRGLRAALSRRCCRCGRGTDHALRHQRRHTPRSGGVAGPGDHRAVRQHRGHSLPRRLRVRGCEHACRGTRGRRPGAGLHQRLRRAHRQCQSVHPDSQPAAQDGPAGCRRPAAGAADGDRSRRCRDRQHRPSAFCAVHRSGGVHAQGWTAHRRDEQGGVRVSAHRPTLGRQQTPLGDHATVRSRYRAGEGSGFRRRPDPGSSACQAGCGRGQAAGVQRPFIRGRGGVIRAARPSGARQPGTFHAHRLHRARRAARGPVARLRGHYQGAGRRYGGAHGRRGQRAR